MGERPWRGQTVMSPTRAMPLPSQSLSVDASTTVPPCDVLSPNTINGPAMLSSNTVTNIQHAMLHADNIFPAL
jgi:hypothetical protein